MDSPPSRHSSATSGSLAPSEGEGPEEDDKTLVCMPMYTVKLGETARGVRSLGAGEVPSGALEGCVWFLEGGMTTCLAACWPGGPWVLCGGSLGAVRRTRVCEARTQRVWLLEGVQWCARPARSMRLCHACLLSSRWMQSSATCTDLLGASAAY